MWPKYLSLATSVHTTFSTVKIWQILVHMNKFSEGSPKILLNLETTPDIKVSGTFKDYHELLNKRLKYLHEILQNFK